MGVRVEGVQGFFTTGPIVSAMFSYHCNFSGQTGLKARIFLLLNSHFSPMKHGGVTTVVLNPIKALQHPLHVVFSV